MALINIGGYVMDTHTAAELLQIIGRVPQNKRASFLDGLKDPDYYKGIEAEEHPQEGAQNG